MTLDGYWQQYAVTLARIRAWRPANFAALKAILDEFQTPSASDAFFPDGADDVLAAALVDAGWNVESIEPYYRYRAEHPQTHARLVNTEGDLTDYTGKAWRDE